MATAEVSAARQLGLLLDACVGRGGPVPPVARARMEALAARVAGGATTGTGWGTLITAVAGGVPEAVPTHGPVEPALATVRATFHSRELRRLFTDAFSDTPEAPVVAPRADMSWRERVQACAAAEPVRLDNAAALARRRPWATFYPTTVVLGPCALIWRDDPCMHGELWRTLLQGKPHLGMPPRLARYVVRVLAQASRRDASWLARVAGQVERRLRGFALALQALPPEALPPAAVVSTYWRLRSAVAVSACRHGLRDPHVVAAIECFVTTSTLAHAGAADCFRAWDSGRAPHAAALRLAEWDQTGSALVEWFLRPLLRVPAVTDVTRDERECLETMTALRDTEPALAQGCALDALLG